MSRLAPNRHTAPAMNVGQELVFTHDLRPAASMLECLRAVWIEAQREAHGSYEGWRDDARPDGYLAYRAAQHRADAAQDALARGALRAGADSAASDRIR